MGGGQEIPALFREDGSSVDSAETRGAAQHHETLFENGLSSISVPDSHSLTCHTRMILAGIQIKLCLDSRLRHVPKGSLRDGNDKRCGNGQVRRAVAQSPPMAPASTVCHTRMSRLPDSAFGAGF